MLHVTSFGVEGGQKGNGNLSSQGGCSYAQILQQLPMEEGRSRLSPPPVLEEQSKANGESPIQLLMNLPLPPSLRRMCNKLHPCPVITSSIRGHEMSSFYHTRHRHSQTTLLHSNGDIMSEKHEKALVFFFVFFSLSRSTDHHPLINSSEMFTNIYMTTSR